MSLWQASSENSDSAEIPGDSEDIREKLMTLGDVAG